MKNSNRKTSATQETDSESNAKPGHPAIVDIKTRRIPQKNIVTTEDIPDLDVLVVPHMVTPQADTDAQSDSWICSRPETPGILIWYDSTWYSPVA